MVSISSAKNRTHKAAGILIDWGNWVLTTRDAVSSSRKVDLDDATMGYGCENGTKQYIISEAPDLNVYPKWDNSLSKVYQNQFWDMQKTFCHPFLDEWNERKSFTSIGLIKLVGSVPLQRKNDKKGKLKSIELIDEDVYILHGRKLIVAGWGVTDPLPLNPPFGGNLMNTFLSVDRNCPPNKFYKPLAHICSYTKNVGICDWGGPALWETAYDEQNRYRDFLAGILAFNDLKNCRLVH